MNSCVRRKFLGKLGKRILWVLGGIATFCGVVAFLLVVNRGGWLSRIVDVIAPFCAGGFILLGLIGGIGAIRDWCKETARECRWECENEERDANPRR